MYAMSDEHMHLAGLEGFFQTLPQTLELRDGTSCAGKNHRMLHENFAKSQPPVICYLTASLALKFYVYKKKVGV
jgi:hypothetical protein